MKRSSWWTVASLGGAACVIAWTVAYGGDVVIHVKAWQFALGLWLLLVSPYVGGFVSAALDDYRVWRARPRKRA